ncbi:glycoside hydrolase family 19 protein, partial [Pseudoxanthobacter sp.]|uniref:glycoside hydrolase family 19 protein n=1 Tax=Pseudoxanthobacter sp. TaxID=1925742 RepID=UPI002FE35166
MYSEATLFSAIDAPLFPGVLKPAQQEGIRTIIDCWQKEAGAAPAAALAYVLATAYHETATTMQPIAEYGGDAYKTRLYDVNGDNPQRARRNGNDKPGDGIRYAGRGYVQLTWKTNYRHAGERLGIDLVAQPDLAL